MKTKFPLGEIVKVIGFSDDCAEKKYLNKTGIVIGHICEDTGATFTNPLHIVQFNKSVKGKRAKTESYWFEELEKVPVTKIDIPFSATLKKIYHEIDSECFTDTNVVSMNTVKRVFIDAGALEGDLQ